MQAIRIHSICQDLYVMNYEQVYTSTTIEVKGSESPSLAEVCTLWKYLICPVEVTSMP